ncbi:MAG: DUF3046 domain-containing protein [Aquiluna sp.]|nr:DUF3046 domain-containing protein [Aquiluna sp.]
MKLSQFRQLAEDEFGAAFAAVVLKDTRLTERSDKTPMELISEGEDPKDVWTALCSHLGVPKERWHGQPKTKQHAEK